VIPNDTLTEPPDEISSQDNDTNNEPIDDRTKYGEKRR
jgi:hypothetical protein